MVKGFFCLFFFLNTCMLLKTTYSLKFLTERIRKYTYTSTPVFHIFSYIPPPFSSQFLNVLDQQTSTKCTNSYWWYRRSIPFCHICVYIYIMHIVYKFKIALKMYNLILKATSTSVCTSRFFLCLWITTFSFPSHSSVLTPVFSRDGVPVKLSPA